VDQAQEQRRLAEARLAAGASTPRPWSGEDAARLVHELQVHQVELEMQNDELRGTQGELEASRDRYSTLYHQAPIGYLTIDRRGKIQEVNLTATAMLGMERAHLLGQHLAMFVNREDAAAFFRYQRDVLVEERKQGRDFRMRRAGGPAFIGHLDSVADPASKDADGRCTQFFAVLTDVSGLRQTEARLQESEARFRELAERIEDVFYVRDARGALTYVSPAFERIWGQSAAPLLGKTSAWLETIDLEDRDRVADAWARMREGAPVSEVYRIRRRDGASRWVHSRAFPVLGADGRVDHFVGVVRDVSTEHRLEAELRQAQKLEAVGTLAGGVAHNLRNTLQAMLLFIRIAQTSEGGDRLERALARALASGKRGAELIDQLMIFARGQAPNPERLPCNVDAVVREAAILIRPLLGNAITLAIETRAPGAIVMADVVGLEQVLLNLARNARDAMPGGGTFAISTEETTLDEQTGQAHGVAQGPHVKLIVRDTGSGMDDETKARIFEPFFTTKEVDRGTGLGLSTVFGIVRRFGGAIDVESRKGEGTAFTIHFPPLKSELRS
jgi:PAS domain S-box-containing protein